MKFSIRSRALILLLAGAAFLMLSPAAQNAPRGPAPTNGPDQEEPVRLPNGKLQRDEILKAEHEQNLRDAAQLIELSEELKADLEKNDRFVVSMGTLKKTDDIEKLVKKIRTRLRHN